MPDSTLPTVALVGRTNVGKSTLFNRLIGRQKALVSPEAGTTRDRKEGMCVWCGKVIRVVDTGGLDVDEQGEIERGTIRQTGFALKEADAIVFVVDLKAGVLPQDIHLAKKLRSLGKPILVAGNKAEKRSERMSAQNPEWRLGGLPAPYPISGVQGNGVGDLLDELFLMLEKRGTVPAKQQEEKICRIAVIGKPNVGKSSLLNSILKRERFIVSAIAHTTREPNDTLVEIDGERFLLIDTAGIRKKSKVRKAKGLEAAGVRRTEKILKEADVALFLVDASEKIGNQERVLAGMVENAQVGIVLIANKWDLVRDKTSKTMKTYHENIAASIPFLQWAPMLFTSALTGQRVDHIFNLVKQVRQARKLVVSERELERFFQDALHRHKPSKGKGPEAPKILGIKQIDSDPPVFEIMLKSRRVDSLHPSYLRFLENRLRESFPLQGTPVILKVRSIISS